MLPLGLTGADQRAFYRTLADSHSVRVEVAVTDLNGDVLSRLDPDAISGQVNVDADAAITRSLTMSILDPSRSLALDSDSPADGALYLDRMLRVVYSVKVPGLGWVDVPVFTGPVTKVDRAGALVNVECQGKEALALGAFWHPMTLKKGHDKVGAIRTILRERAGETRFDLPDLPWRLHRTVSFGREAVPWTEARRIARSMDRQLFYDGRGVCRLRNYPGHVFTFRSGDGGLIVSAPQVSYSTERVRNAVWVKGGKPKGVTTDDDPNTPAPKSVPDVQFRDVAPPWHPLSPVRLGRKLTDGTVIPLHRLEVIENPRIRSREEARRVAKRRLNDLLMEAVDVTFESLPVPHLEPMDIIRVTTREATVQVRLRSYSLPLVVGENMSVGFHKLVSVPRRRNRR